MTQTPQSPAIRRPLWLGLLLCVFLLAAPGSALAHGTDPGATALTHAAAQSGFSTALADDPGTCPATTGQHDRNCCAGHGACHAAALVQEAPLGAAASGQRPTPRPAAGRAGNDVAPLFHPPKSLCS
jgi:hypothetical protein